MIRFTFNKKLRLLKPLHFSHVFQQPHKVKISEIIILGRRNFLRYPRIGIAISKRNVKHAHARNRIKRLIRESFRLHQHQLPSMDFVVIVKNGILNFNNYTLLVSFEKLWQYYYQLTRNS